MPAEPRDGFSIRAVARMTGVEPDTLRIWERRYGFPSPARTAGGARVYTADDVELLRMIPRALSQGFRAGEVVGRSKAELVGMLDTASTGAIVEPVITGFASDAPGVVQTLLTALRSDDAVAVRATLRKAAVTLGPKRFVIEVSTPLVSQVGALWAQGELAIRHEHLLTELLSTQLRLLLSATEDAGGSKTVLLATPPGERHALGLQMTAVYVAFHQVQPRLLGVDTPPEQIVNAAIGLGVDAVGLTVSEAADRRAVTLAVRKVAKGLPSGCVLWVGGAGAAALDLGKSGARVVRTWADLDEAIRSLHSARNAVGGSAA